MNDSNADCDLTPLALDALEAGFFEPLRDSVFLLMGGQGDLPEIELKLVEVSVLGHRRPDAVREPFSLTFRGPAGCRLGQGIQRLRHPEAGVVEVFITQIGDGAGGSQFEVIFT